MFLCSERGHAIVAFLGGNFSIAPARSLARSLCTLCHVFFLYVDELGVVSDGEFTNFLIVALLIRGSPVL